MRRLITVSVVAMVLAGAVALPRAVADDRTGTVHGQFVRRLEREHGDMEYLAIEVKTDRGKVTLLVPRRNEDITHLARKLTEGQEVSVRYIVDSGDKFIRKIEVEGRHRELHEMAERLERGQTVEISFGTEAGVRWASGIKAVGDRDREGKKEKDKDRREED